MAEEGVLARIDQLKLFGPQLRYAVRLARSEHATEIDEACPALLAAYRFDPYFTVRHARDLFRSASVRPSNAG
jgi:hypothetical protein